MSNLDGECLWSGLSRGIWRWEAKSIRPGNSAVRQKKKEKITRNVVMRNIHKCPIYTTEWRIELVVKEISCHYESYLLGLITKYAIIFNKIQHFYGLQLHVIVWPWFITCDIFKNLQRKTSSEMILHSLWAFIVPNLVIIRLWFIKYKVDNTSSLTLPPCDPKSNRIN